MNVYHVSIEPKAQAGAAAGMAPSGSRTLSIVTGSLQDAMSIARTKIGSSEEITGIYISANDVIVDYSQVINATGGN